MRNVNEFNYTIKHFKDYVLLQPRKICDKDVLSDLIAFFNYKVITDRAGKRYGKTAQNGDLPADFDCTSQQKEATVSEICKSDSYIVTDKGDYLAVHLNDLRPVELSDANKQGSIKGDWADELISLMKKYPDASIAVPKITGPRHMLYAAGSKMLDTGVAYNVGSGDNYDIADYNYVRKCDCAVDAAFVVRKSALDKALENGGRIIGDILYDPFAVVFSKHDISTIPPVRLAASPSLGQSKTMLMLDFRVPRFDTDAGGRLTYAYIKLYTELGIDVTLLSDDCYKNEPYCEGLNRLGVNVLYGPKYSGNLEAYLEKNLGNFDYVFVQRPHIWVKYEELILRYAKGKIIYLDHDLHHVRIMREYEITGDEALKDEALKWKDIEYDIFKKCDVAYVVGSYEEELVRKALPEVTVRSIPCQVYENEPAKTVKDWSNCRGLLFVGGFNHHPNEDGVLWFAKNVFPKILSKYPDMIWHIAGSSVTDAIKNLSSSNIYIDGFVSDERLHELYELSRIVVVPLRYGAGVKGKVLEACFNMAPLVTTAIGAEGLPLEGVCEIEDDPDKMADAIIKLYEDYDELTAMAQRERRFIIDNSMTDTALRIIKQDL